MKLGIRGKLLIVLLSISAINLIIFGGITLRQFSRTAEDIENDRLDSDLNSLVALASAVIEPEDILALADNEDESDSLYESVREQLVALSSANPLIDSNRIFIAVPGDLPDEVIVVVDSEEDPEVRFLPGEIHVPDPEDEKLLDGFEGFEIDDFIFFDENDENFVYGYGPLRDNDGESVAVIAVELGAQAVFETLDEVLITFLITAGAIAPAVVILSLLIAKVVVDPLDDIIDATEVMERGDTFEENMLERVSNRKDELGLLARVFSRMAIEVQAREKKLKQDVAELKIQIDLVKANKQVAEITDTEFFKDLQKRARKMREDTEQDKT